MRVGMHTYSVCVHMSQHTDRCQRTTSVSWRSPPIVGLEDQTQTQFTHWVILLAWVEDFKELWEP